MLSKTELLRIFVTVSESSSFKEAAIKLKISPQKVTRSIKELEKTLGDKLFYRNTRTINITDLGQSILEDSKFATSHIDNLFSLEETVNITAPIF